MLTKNLIIEQLKKLADFAEDNLHQINPLLKEEKEILDFYYGYIRRQWFFSVDLSTIFAHSSHNSFVSQFILSRCIVDDYLHLVYILHQPNSEDAIIALNADAHKRNFDKISELAEVNESILEGNFPLYPTFEMRDQVKEKLQNSAKKAHYFSDVASFKFKTFKQTGNFIKDFPKDQFGAQIRRAYYLWRHLSDYIHYSKFSFDLEFYPENNEHSFNFIQEIIYYSYRVVKLSFESFQSEFGLSLIDRHDLQTFYKLTEAEEK
jgi:hypothetical protein